MNDRVKALLEFMELESYNLKKSDRYYLEKLHVRILDFSKRYALADAIDIYVDIKHFIQEGVKRIKDGENVWYKQDFIDAGLMDNKKIRNW